MKCALLLTFLFVSVSTTAFPQDAGCLGAMSALLRVKEEITPDLKDQSDLKRMQRTLQDGSRSCNMDLPEMLYYRKLVADRLGDKREAELIAGKLKKLQYKPTYSDPFTQPESAAPAPAAVDDSASKVGRKWALVVGINQFAADSITPLRFAKQDSVEFAGYLTDAKGGRFRKDRVKLLVDQEATVANFRSGIGWLRDNVQPGDLVVIYVSSHGSPPDSDPNKVSFIAMHDTKPDDLFATSVEMIDLVQMINREIKARRVVLFLDTCFSGDASNAGREAYDGSKRFAPPPNAPSSEAFSGALANLKMGVGRAVITASRANEESFENVKLRHGYFTSYLIKELRDSGDKLPLGDVFSKVRQDVITAVSTDYKGRTQTPSSEFSDRAATIIISVPEADSSAKLTSSTASLAMHN